MDIMQSNQLLSSLSRFDFWITSISTKNNDDKNIICTELCSYRLFYFHYLVWYLQQSYGSGRADITPIL